jgi:hypothetical protein
MNYEQALQRAKITPVMRPHWHWVWLTFEGGRHRLLHDDGRVEAWRACKADRKATDWVDAPRSPDEP